MFSQSDIESLKTAIAQGLRRVRFGDREVEYRSLAEMERTLIRIERALHGHRPERFVAKFTKGLER